MNIHPIKTFLLHHVMQHPRDIVEFTAAKFDVSRTTVHRHLKRLLKQNLIIKSGKTKNTHYFLGSSLNREFTYPITPQLSESSVFESEFKHIFEQFPENIYDILCYGFTEIFNNAMDHSQGSKITVSTRYENSQLILTITDNGIGIFQKITDYFDLKDIRESILQLSKGKMTTDPANHTGEGIFFSSRAFDRFEIWANTLYYVRDNYENDWAFNSSPTPYCSSKVRMMIRDNSETQLVAIFKQYQDPDSLAFNRTEITVALAKLQEEKLISRSQAKRITFGLEKFSNITLDFSRIKLVGQGFVDEIFRVYANAHPNTKITYINANDDVEFMIKRSLATHR